MALSLGPRKVLLPSVRAPEQAAAALAARAERLYAAAGQARRNATRHKAEARSADVRREQAKKLRVRLPKTA